MHIYTEKYKHNYEISNEIFGSPRVFSRNFQRNFELKYKIDESKKKISLSYVFQVPLLMKDIVNGDGLCKNIKQFYKLWL